MPHGTSKQATCDLLQAQMRLFEEAARAAGLTEEAWDVALRRAFGPHEAALADWREFVAGRGTLPVASPDLLRRIGRLTYRLVVETEQTTTAMSLPWPANVD